MPTRDGRSAALEEMATDVRRSIVTMIDRAQLGHIGGDLSVTDILVTLFGAVLAVDPRASRGARPRPVRPQQGPLRRRRSTRRSPAAGSSPRRARDVHGAAVALNGHPDRKKVPGVETNTGPLGHGFPVAVGIALAAQLQREPLAHLRRARRRRAPGGQQLGGGDDRVALRASTRSPRSSTATACSRARAPRTPSSSSRSPTSGRASAGRCARSTGTTTARCSRPFAPVDHRQAGRGDRPHDQGQGRVLHRGPRRVAPQGARRRAGAGRARGALAMTFPLAQDAQTYDCRKAFAEELIALAREDERDRRRLQRLRRLEQPRRLPRGVPRPADQRRHRRAGPRRRRRRPGQRRPAPVRLGRRAVPHRPRARADQGRRGLQQRPRGAVRPEPGHGLRRARADAPLDRGPLVDARDRQPPGRRAGRPARRRARPSAGRRRAPARRTCASRATRSRTVTPDGAAFGPGTSVQLTDGDDVTVIAIGTMVSRALDAAERLRARGHRRARDQHGVRRPARRAGRPRRGAPRPRGIVTAEEATVSGGLGAAVAALVVEHQPVPMRILGVPRRVRAHRQTPPSCSSTSA